MEGSSLAGDDSISNSSREAASESSRDWSSLPDIAVFSIATRLNPIEFLAFSGVCKCWRSVCKSFKTQINALQPPLLVNLNCIGYHGKRSVCEVYSFPDKRRYWTPLSPEFDNRPGVCVGFSHGYIILSFAPDVGDASTGDRLLYLANPFTRDQFWMPSPAPFFIYCATLTASRETTSNDGAGGLILAFSEFHMMYCRRGDSEWSVFRYNFEPFSYPMQAVFFHGRVYCRMDWTTILTIELFPEPKLTADPFVFRQEFRNFNAHQACLVAGEDELFLFDLPSSGSDSGLRNRAFQLQDLSKGNWVQVDCFGGRTLFATYGGGVVPRTTTIPGWEEGWEDCICFAYPFIRFEFKGKRGSCFPEADVASRSSFPDIHSFRSTWISPSQCC